MCVEQFKHPLPLDDLILMSNKNLQAFSTILFHDIFFSLAVILMESFPVFVV